MVGSGQDGQRRTEGAPGAPRAVRQVAGVDSRLDAVLVGVQLFPVRSIHLVHPPEREADARSLAASLGRLRVATTLHAADRLDFARLIDRIVEVLRGDGEAVVNLSSGWEEYSFAALTAAFLTGSAAFVVQRDEVVPVPVLRVSYPDVLSPAKLNLLRSLHERGPTMLVKELAEATRLTPSLVSYHLRGYRDRPGLEKMGLVETVDQDRRGHAVRLTPIGRNLLAVGARARAARGGNGGGRGEAQGHAGGNGDAGAGAPADPEVPGKG